MRAVLSFILVALLASGCLGAPDAPVKGVVVGEPDESDCAREVRARWNEPGLHDALLAAERRGALLLSWSDPPAGFAFSHADVRARWGDHAALLAVAWHPLEGEAASLTWLAPERVQVSLPREADDGRAAWLLAGLLEHAGLARGPDEAAWGEAVSGSGARLLQGSGAPDLSALVAHVVADEGARVSVVAPGAVALSSEEWDLHFELRMAQVELPATDGALVRLSVDARDGLWGQTLVPAREPEWDGFKRRVAEAFAAAELPPPTFGTAVGGATRACA